MRNRLFLVMIPFFFSECGWRPRPVDDDIPGNHILASQLFSVADAGKVMYGHQDDLSYGHSWKVTDWKNDDLERSDVKDVSGKYPAVLGFDLGGIEVGDSRNLEFIRKKRIKRTKKIDRNCLKPYGDKGYKEKTFKKKKDFILL